MALSRRTLITAGGLAIVAGGVGLYGGDMGLWPKAYDVTPVFMADGFAIRGFDPVAYFTEGKPVPGNPGFAHEWNGAVWLFSNASHRELFQADPEKYAPQYGGFCSWAVAAKRKLYSTQPSNWTIVDDKLYLNYSDRVQKIWDTDRQGFIRDGDRNWPEIQKAG